MKLIIANTTLPPDVDPLKPAPLIASLSVEVTLSDGRVQSTATLEPDCQVEVELVESSILVIRPSFGTNPLTNPEILA